jgi:O-methyltransferase
MADLDRYGLGEIKRHQALRYFTWSWRWSFLSESLQMRFLLKHTPLRTGCRCLISPIALSDASWDGVAWNRRDRWLYSFATRLLWEYARKHDTVGALSLPEPAIGNPLPVRWRGQLISQDLANTALESSAIARALGATDPRSIIEVGAGYGRTAYVLLHIFPDATYTIVDIEPALSISRWYLEQLFPPERLRFLHPDEAESLGDGEADLAIAISSLHEMTADQVERYLKLLDRVAAGGRVYLKQWEHWTNPDDGVTLDFQEYPIPSRWTKIFDECAPVQTNFRHAAWHIETGQQSACAVTARSRGTTADPTPPPADVATYDADGLVVYHKSVDFLADTRFQVAYHRGMQSGHHIARERGSDIDIHIEWRIHVALWAAAHAVTLAGDFVECGVNTGITSLAVCEYIDFNATRKNFWLFDTFQGIPLEQVTERERALGRLDENAAWFSECYELAKANFSAFPRAHLVRGTVPDTLADVDIGDVAYLSLDMNIAEPEIAALEFFWPKLVTGAPVLLDDYGWTGYRPQKEAIDDWAATHHVEVLTLPTGQGLILRPPRTKDWNR